MNHRQQLIRREHGRDVVDYGLLIATSALVVLVAVGLFGHRLGDAVLPR